MWLIQLKETIRSDIFKKAKDSSVELLLFKSLFYHSVILDKQSLALVLLQLTLNDILY